MSHLAYRLCFFWQPSWGCVFHLLANLHCYSCLWSRAAGHSRKDNISDTNDQIGFLRRVVGYWRAVTLEKLRWLRHLFRMRPGRLPGEMFWACPTGGRPRGGPRTRLRDYVKVQVDRCVGVWISWKRTFIMLFFPLIYWLCNIQWRTEVFFSCIIIILVKRLSDTLYKKWNLKRWAMVNFDNMGKFKVNIQ